MLGRVIQIELIVFVNYPMRANFLCNGLIIYITCCELNYVNICMMIYLHVLYECVLTLGHCICT